MTCRLCARDRGFSPLQAVLLLGAAFFVILGLKELFSATGRPQSERAVVEAYGPRTSVGSPGGAPAMVPAVPGPTPTPGPERRVPHTPAQAAEEAHRKITELPVAAELAKEMSLIAFGPPEGAEDRDAFIKLVTDFVKKTGMTINTNHGDPFSGFQAATFEPPVLEPGAKAYVAFAGTAFGTYQDVSTDVGQELPDYTQDQLDTDLEQASRRSWPMNRVGETVARARRLATLQSREQQQRALALVDQLVAKYGRENVIATGTSMGGGHAAFTTAMRGVTAVPINPAPLGPSSMDRIRAEGVPGAEKNIHNIRVGNEILHRISGGTTIGNVITVEGKSWIPGWSIGANHKVVNVDPSRPVSYQPYEPIRR